MSKQDINNTKKNIITNITLQVVLGASGLMIPRLILLSYSSEMNGMINSITQFLTYAGMVELGIMNAAVPMFYKPFVIRDYRSINDIFNTVRRKYISSGCLYLIIVLVVALVYPVFVDRFIPYSHIVFLTMILALPTVIDFAAIGKYKALLLANQKYYIINGIRAGATILILIVSCMFLVRDYNILIVKLVPGIMRFVEAIVIYWYVKRKYNFLYNDKNITSVQVKIPQQKNAFIHQITALINYNTDLIVLTVLGGREKLKIVSVYSVYALAYSFINNLNGGIVVSFEAVFGEMIAEENICRLNSIFRKIEYWFYILIFFMYSCYVALIIPFIRNYTTNIQDINYIDWKYGVLFALSGILASLKDVHFLIIKGYGHFKQTQKHLIIQALINIFLSVVLVPKGGIIGVLIGTNVGHVIADIGIVSYVEKHLLKEERHYTLHMIVRNILLFIFLAYFEIYFMWMVSGWGQWIICASIICVVNLIIYIMINGLADKDAFWWGVDMVVSKFRDIL